MTPSDNLLDALMLELPELLSPVCTRKQGDQENHPG
jgi:hypothetical protein